MSDSYSESSTQGWFSRIGESIKGILVGLVLFVLAFPVLFWNEGRSVKEYQGLQEGAKAVIDVEPDKIDPANQDKLVHMTGLATTTDILKDADFGVDVNALRLKRTAEIYQWKETSTTKTEKNLGGSQTTTTTYDYDKIWSDQPIDSGNFKKKENHVNRGSLQFASHTWTAPKITLGAFTLSSGLSDRIATFEPLPSASVNLSKGSATVQTSYKPDGQWLYNGANPSSPEVGDVRVKFEIVKPTTVSVISQQTGDSFRPFMAKSGTPVERLEVGSHSAKEMFEHAQSESTTLTWILRGVGLFLMWLGVTLLFKPLVVVADVVPFIGGLLEMGIGFFALLLALPLTLTTIAIGWIYYRPIVGISLLAASAALVVLFFYLGKKRGPAKA